MNKKTCLVTSTIVMVRILCPILLACWLITAPSRAAEKPVFTSDFETEMLATGWTTTGRSEYGKNVLWSDTESHSGKHSLAVVKDKDIPIGGGWESPPFPVKYNQYYRVTFFAKTSKPSYWAIFFYNQYGAVSEGDRYSLVEPTEQWTQQEFYFQTKFPGETASIMFQPLTDQALYIDDVRITPATREEARNWADRIYAGMPQIDYTPPLNAGQLMPNTRRKIKQGKPLRIVLLGDSIAMDLSNSLLDTLLEREFPKTHIEMLFTGKGGTGWLKHQHQVGQRVIQHKPDLVICEAISNDPKYLAQPLERIIDTTHEASPMTEFLLVTPHLRSWSDKKDNGLLQSNVLLEVAKAKQVEVVDLMTAWESYLTKNNTKVEWLLRDSVHMNERGRQLSARVLAAYFGIQAR